jgi:hypothetical protein
VGTKIREILAIVNKTTHTVHLERFYLKKLKRGREERAVPC